MHRKNLFLILVFVALIIVPLFTAAPISASAPIGNHLVFNGGTIKAQNLYQEPPVSFVFEVWVKPKFVSGERNILKIRNTADNQINYEIGINGGSFSFEQQYSTSAYRLINSGSIVKDIWQHLKITMDANTSKMFIDDRLVFDGNGISGLKAFNGEIIAGENYFGDMDQLTIGTSQNTILQWNFDQNRGETAVADTSGNGINGQLIGGDTKIHYFGVLPTPTKYILPTLPSIRRITFGENPNPTYPANPTPWQNNSVWNRNDRPSLPR